MNKTEIRNVLLIKTTVLFLTLLLIVGITTGISTNNIIVFLLLPALFDAGHFTLASYYQYKTKQFNYFYLLKVVLAIVISACLLYWGNSTFNRWIVYAFGAWHVLNGEKYTLSSTNTFSELEVLFPSSIYAYLTYLKFFNVDIYRPLIGLFFLIIILCAAWNFKKKKISLLENYFLMFAFVNTIALIFYEKIPLLLIITFYIYFHYISWYIYSSLKHKDLRKHLTLTISVNLFYFLVIFVLILIPFGETVAKYLGESFFIPGWLLFHLVSTIRPFGPFVQKPQNAPFPATNSQTF